MTYLLLFICIILYTSVLKKIKSEYKVFILFSLPIFTFLVLMLGYQDNVGTDYYSYFSMAEGTKDIGFLKRKWEFLFLFLVKLAQYFKNPQLIFFFAAIIQTLFFMLIIYKVREMGYRLDIFFFLYFTLSLTFFNQFNGIRQYIAVYIMLYAVLQLMDEKYVFFVFLTIVAGLFHISAYFLLPLILLQIIIRKKLPLKFVLIVLSGMFLLSFINLDRIYDKILVYIPMYKYYIKSSYMERLTFESIITKIPKMAIVLFSVLKIDYDNIRKEDTFLVNMSLIACGILILSFTSSIIWRFYQYFDMYLIFPVMILMHDKQKKAYSDLIAIALIIM